MLNGKNEKWVDTILRVVNGVMTIRKDYNKKHILPWDEAYWQQYAFGFAVSMFKMEFLPPGRGLWAMGTNFVKERGSTALYNCAFTSTENLLESSTWCMDFLMHGCGVGFDTSWEGKDCIMPEYLKDKSDKFDKSDKSDKSDTSYTFVIPDSREGWCESLYALINAFVPSRIANSTKKFYNKYPLFDYSLIRPAGVPIKGFGGIASGPEPLIKLHERVIKYLTDFSNKITNATRCVVDIFNSIGACVVAGNVRRSAEIALGNVNDETFLDLKNYEKNPDRMEIGWMSNNSVILKESKDFDKLKRLTERIKLNGEPGIINAINVKKYARFGKEKNDDATGTNPCGEITLESGEVCNLVEIFPTRCLVDESLPFDEKNFDEKAFYQASKYATFYASTVSLLPTHNVNTNIVVARNRRIGVSISGITDWFSGLDSSYITPMLRKAYEIIEKSNQQLARYAGVPASIRLTTIKPSGSISLLAGVSSGMHFPTFKYAIRRMRSAMNSPISDILIASGVPYEKDVYSDNTYVFEFPIDQGKTRKATDVSIWEQFSLAAMLQREFSDNSVSVTIYYDPIAEVNEVDKALAYFIPLMKSVSILPHTDAGSYPQMPYEGITQEQYQERLDKMPKINWDKFSGSDGEFVKYCTNDSCEIIDIKK